MKTIYKFQVIIALFVFAVIASAVISNHGGRYVDSVQASGNALPNFPTMASSTSSLVNTSSTFVVATNTARVYLQISNLSGATPLFCNLRNGAPAVLYSGLTIFASSTQVFDEDKFPYTGAINCISAASASTTIIEK